MRSRTISFPKNHQVAGGVRRVKADGEELKETYARFAEHTHGAILRDELAWNEYWLWDRDDIMAAIYYNENEEPDGYIIYWIENEVFYIKDMIFNHEEARTGLWNFVSAHFSMIDRVEGAPIRTSRWPSCWRTPASRSPSLPTIWRGLWISPRSSRTIPSRRTVRAGVALLHDGPNHGVQPGLVPAEDIKGRQGGRL